MIHPIRRAMAPLAALLLASCGNPSSPNNTTATVIADPVGEMRPGLWKASVTTHQGSQSGDLCITPADVAQARMFDDQIDDEMCKVVRRTMSGGAIDIEATCGSDEGASRLRVTGRYSATSYEARTQVATGGETAAITTSGRWSAPTCPADANR